MLTVVIFFNCGDFSVVWWGVKSSDFRFPVVIFCLQVVGVVIFAFYGLAVVIFWWSPEVVVVAGGGG